MKTIYYIYGLRRGGNHVFINWLFNHFDPNDAIFLNNQWKKSFSIRKDEIHGHIQNIIVGFEDKRLIFGKDKLFKKFNKGKKVKSVLILRDLYNLFASRIKGDIKNLSHRNEESREILRDRWKKYAREYLGETGHLQNRTVVNYNLFVTFPEYRMQIERKLRIKETKDSLNRVPLIGGGSSFDGRSYHGRGSEMKVLERWKYYENDENYLDFFNDEEVKELSKKIFDFNPV